MGAGGEAEELARASGAAKRHTDGELPRVRAELAPGDRLVLVAAFKGMHQAGTLTLKDFVIRRAR